MKPSFGDKLFFMMNYTILTLAALSCILPFIHIGAVSFSDNRAITSGLVDMWPVGFNIASYKSLFVGTNVIQAFVNSVIITCVGTLLNMIFTILCAYPLSRTYFIGRRMYMLAIVFTMLFQAGLIPNFLLIKSLGLMNSYWAIWLPGLVGVYNMLVIRTFFTSIPEELIESANIDGCSEWSLLFKVILPLSMPVLAAVTLFYIVGHWNAFLNVLMYINTPELYNLTVMVQNMIRSQELIREIQNQDPAAAAAMLTPESIKAAGILVMVAPMLLVYPFLQKYFVKGIMIGAVKG